MIMKKIFTLFAAMMLAAVSYAQLPDGSIAPDFTVYEINKTTGEMITDQPINLYNLLDNKKAVFIDISATWCGHCWNFHQTGTLDDLWTNYGPNSSNYDSYVIWMEGDAGNYPALSGTGADADGYASQGDWLNGVEFPIVPLNMDPNTPNKNTILNGYSLAYFPTVYLVCPSRMAFEMSRNGSNQAQQWHNLISTKCPSTTNTNDAALGVERSSKTIYYCDYSIQPKLTLQNVGTANLTSATLRLTHGSEVQTIPWTGNLAQYETTLLTLPTVSGTENGNRTFTVEIVDVNGQPDEGNTLNSHSETFLNQSESSTATAVQKFASSNITPWYLEDNTNGYCYIYQGQLLFNAYSIPSGRKAELYAPLMNFTNAPAPKISFDLCYKRRNDNSNDKLQIMASSDCGATWTTVFNKSGEELATGSNTTQNYVPAASAYQTQTVELEGFASKDKVIIKFVFTSAKGNNIWMDNINIMDGATDIEDVEQSSSIAIFPNPAKEVLNITSDKAISQIDVYDVNGKMVKSFTSVGSTLNIKDLATGVYMLNVTTEDGVIVKKIVKE